MQGARKEKKKGRLRRKLSKLMPHHLLGDSQVNVVLAVVYLELEADKVGQDGGGPGLGADGSDLLAGLGALDGESVLCL